MHSCAIKLFAGYVAGAAFMAGCASPHPPHTASVQSGKVVAVEPPTVAGYPGMGATSGMGAAGASASSEPTFITVLFSDGTQGRYSMDQKPADAFVVGDPVQIITDSQGTTIMSP